MTVPMKSYWPAVTPSLVLKSNISHAAKSDVAVGKAAGIKPDSFCFCGRDPESAAIGRIGAWQGPDGCRIAGGRGIGHECIFDLSNS